MNDRPDLSDAVTRAHPFDDGAAAPVARSPMTSFRPPGERRRKARASDRALAPEPPPSLPGRSLRLVPLPRYLTTLVGRKREAAAVADLLDRPDARLVTLTGPAGIGKTRLAVAVAGAVAGDVAFVSLAAIRTAGQVLPTTTRALAIPDRAGLTDLERLVVALRDRRLLLVLDNVEHVAGCAPALVDLLAACPMLTILATSRSPLRVSGEHRAAVPPLHLPASGTTAGRSAVTAGEVAEAEAVRLFVERARAAAPDFALTDANAGAVAAICGKLGGLPLAIELAAARIPILTPAELDARLSRQLPLLVGGPRDQPARLRSMRAAVAWSYGLVAEPARRLFRRLAVAPGGLTLAAVEWMLAHDPPPAATDGEPTSAIDLLAELVDAGLVQQGDRTGDESRFVMLEPIGEFARERLDAAGEHEAARRLLMDWLLARADAGDWRRSFAAGVEETGWFAAWEREWDNVRAALAWAAPEPLLRMAGALFLFWWRGEHISEGRSWLERGLTGSGVVDPQVRAFALAVASALAHRQDDIAAAEDFAGRAGALWRSVGDLGGVAYAEYMLAIVRYRQGDLADAERLYLAAVDGLRTDGSAVIAAEAQVGLAQVQRDRGRLDEAAASYAEALRAQEAAGIGWGAALSRYGCATICQMRGDVTRALHLYRASLGYWREIGDWGSVAVCLEGIASACCAAGDAGAAVRLFGAAQSLREASASPIPCRVFASYGAAFESVLSRLGPSAFAAGWLAGWGLPIDEAIAEAIALRPRRPAPARRATNGPEALSRREREVLRLVAAGYTDREIADLLSISKRTASDHVGHILRKLDARSRSDAAAFAVRNGLA